MRDLISIIIPTNGNRMPFLSRAIDSAGAVNFDIEVIVVVNGPYAKEFELPRCGGHHSVRVVRIAQAGVSNARNVGLSEAAGKWVRFLDDDDYLVPEVAERQYELARSSNSDIVTAKVGIVDHGGKLYGTSSEPLSNDIYCELLSTRLPVVPLAHVYKSTSIKHICWNARMNLSEDTDWLHRVARDREMSWLHMNKVVGFWYQHAVTKRLTSSFNNNRGMAARAESVLETYRHIESESRLTPARRSAAALGLWKTAHVAFYLAPIYWSTIIRISLGLDRNVIARDRLYLNAARFHLHPLLIDWLMLPKRYLNHFLRPAIRHLRGTAHIRQF